MLWIEQNVSCFASYFGSAVVNRNPDYIKSYSILNPKSSIMYVLKNSLIPHPPFSILTPSPTSHIPTCFLPAALGAVAESNSRCPPTHLSRPILAIDFEWWKSQLPNDWKLWVASYQEMLQTARIDRCHHRHWARICWAGWWCRRFQWKWKMTSCRHNRWHFQLSRKWRSYPE